MASGQLAADPVYKLKRVDFFGRKTPVALQNENGPCPLLAIANILLLKKQIELPEHAPDISQNRLVSLVAGYLLDANDEQKIPKGLPEEYKANLQKNVADAIGILAKLTTGIDVNVRFHDVKGFEFTDEIAIFDLLDISLVHGWLVDPQDSAVAAALGQKSYNELVEQLVLILGDATPKGLLTPQLSRRTSEYSTPRRTSSGLGAVGPSDLLSPTEIAPPSREACATQKAAAPPPGSGAAAGQDAQLASSVLDAPSGAPLGTVSSSVGNPPSLHEAAASGAPLGTMASSVGTPPGLHDAGEVGGPAGSLVRAQQPAEPHDSPSLWPAESAPGVSQDGPHDATRLPSATAQLHRPLLSPAADMASRVYPLPAPPLEEGGLSTPQSSGTYDAHIATAPTPYPSLASDFSQPGSPASPQGAGGSPLAAALRASLAPWGTTSTGSLAAGSSSESKSRLASTTFAQGLSSEEDVTAMDDQGAAASRSNADNHAGGSSVASPQAGSTAASEQLARGAQDPTMPDVNSNSGPELGSANAPGQGQQAAASSDAQLAGLKLEDADSEQLQLALAISLGQQEGETAQEATQGSVQGSGQGSVQPHDQPSTSPRAAQTGTTSVTSGAEPTQPAPDHNSFTTDASGGALPGSDTLEASQAGLQGDSITQAAAVPTAPASSTNQGQHAQPPQVEAHPSHDAMLQAPDVAAPGTHDASSGTETPSGPAPQDTPEQQGPDLLAAQAGASQHEGQDGGGAAGQSHGEDATPQQPSSTASLPGFRHRSSSDQDEKSKAAAQAHIIQDFLESTSSQLTHHGLASLREGLRPNELAVFFRNNHFNTIFLHKGVVHILVTDQGYEFEKNVVWEKLDDLTGNTQFLKADFMPYGSTSLSEQVSDAADLVQAAFAGNAPTKARTSPGAGDEDADFALALQLHQEEERRAAVMQQQTQLQSQQHGQRGSSHSRQQSNSRVGPKGNQGRPPRGRSNDQGAQSFANPMQHARTAQKAPGQEQEKTSISSTVAKWFGFSSKK